MTESFTVDGDSVIVRKVEYEGLLQDSILSDLTRRFLHEVKGEYSSLGKLRFIYDIPVEEEDK